MGTKPSEATNAVINTGRRRVTAPCRTACSSDSPCSRMCRMKLIITRPLSTATPDRAMKPMPAEIENGIPRRISAITPPVSASGTPLNTIAASLTDPKAQNNNAKISTSVTGTTIAKRWLAEISCSKLPPYSIQ